MLTKQLLANIHKNRLGVSQQLLDGDSSLSYSRKLAINSLKTKLDEQSTKIQKNEDMVYDQMQALKRHDKMLNKADAMVKQVETSDGELKEKIVKELNAVFDKYCKTYSGAGPKREVSKFSRKDRITQYI